VRAFGDVLTTFEIFARKVSETMTDLEKSSAFTCSLNFPQHPVVLFDKTTPFKGMFIDFEYMSLNGKFKAIRSDRCYPFNVFNALRPLISEADKTKCDKLVLMLDLENTRHFAGSRIDKIKKSLTVFSTKKSNMKYLVLYLFLYLVQKEFEMDFNYSIVDIFNFFLKVDVDILYQLFLKVDFLYVFRLPYLQC